MRALGTSGPDDRMVWIPEGAFRMGSDDWYSEERPARRARVNSFWIDKTPVTVADFHRFVDATGYLTLAERPIDPTPIPTLTQSCSFPARPCSLRPAARSRSTRSSGGATPPVDAGIAEKEREAA
jgi:formylglycine-generating enzyme